MRSILIPIRSLKDRFFSIRVLDRSLPKNNLLQIRSMEDRCRNEFLKDRSWKERIDFYLFKTLPVWLLYLVSFWQTFLINLVSYISACEFNIRSFKRTHKQIEKFCLKLNIKNASKIQEASWPLFMGYFGFQIIWLSGTLESKNTGKNNRTNSL